jgi:hypothetical protein
MATFYCSIKSIELPRRVFRGIFSVIFTLLLVMPSLPCQAQTSNQEYAALMELVQDGHPQELIPLFHKFVASHKHPHPSVWLHLGNLYYDRSLELLMEDQEETSLVYLDSAGIFFYAGYQAIQSDGELTDLAYYEAFLKGRQRSRISQDLLMDMLKKRIVQIEKRLQKVRGSQEAGHIPTANLVKPTGKYYALIIGVSEYNDPQLSLDRPLEDAKKLKQLLMAQYNFRATDIKFLSNPNRQQIIKELFALRKKVGPQDNLLVFFAGHGYWDQEVSQGYWWPKDAQADDPSHWLSNSDLREQIRGIKSAHTLVISDACFSGGIFKTRDPGDIKRAGLDIVMLYKNPSRRAMTSGTLTTVPDQSVFFDYLYKALSDNTDKFLPSGDLFSRFRQAVINNSRVVPQDGVIAETGDEGGDFIFIRQ